MWVIKSNQWLTNKPEVEIEALELHACRIFDNPLWVGYVEFNEKYRPEVLHGVELVWVVNQVETTPQRITRVKMERDIEKTGVCVVNCSAKFVVINGFNVIGIVVKNDKHLTFFAE